MSSISNFVISLSALAAVSEKQTTRRPIEHTLHHTTNNNTNLTNWTRPAEFTVGTDIINQNPGAFTATMAENPSNTLFHAGAFEPIMVRRRYIAENGTNRDTIIVNPTSLSEYDSYRDGWLNCAGARVYRLFAGKFELIRNDTVKTTRCSGWVGANSVVENEMLSTTSFVEKLPGWFRPNASAWYAVTAVDKNGNESEKSVAVKIEKMPLPPNGSPANNSVLPKPKMSNAGNTTVPQAPTGLKVEVDTTQGIMRFSWDPVIWPSLAGYGVYRSEVAPDDMQGYGIDLAGPGVPLSPGDMIFFERKDYSFNRSFISDRIWNAQGSSNPKMLGLTLQNSKEQIYNGEGSPVSWELVPHPQPVPQDLAPVAGETCVRIDVKDVSQTPYVMSSGGTTASTNQSYYPVLNSNDTYAMELWARADDATSITLTYSGPSISGLDHAPDLIHNILNLTSQWQFFKFDVTSPWVYNVSGAVQEGEILFGTTTTSIYLDNWRFYNKGGSYMGLVEMDKEALQSSGLQYIRTHAFIKSTFGYDMESLTNSPGVTQYQYNGDPKTMHTLASMLAIIKEGNANPWLQVEQFMSESELLGLVEYLAAPYDPKKDSPINKPWASKRFLQGQELPYTDMFDKFIYEISNEQWNGMFMPWGFAYGTCMPDHSTGAVECQGALAGFWQEKTISLLRSSEYWTPAVENKFKFVVGGWANSDGPPNGWHNGFGTNAVVHSPNTAIMNIAGYNGGWDAGEAPAIPDDSGFFKALSFTVQNADPVSQYLAHVRINLTKYNHTNIFDGTYEAGPGYNMNGLNGVKMNSSQVESESQVMKSLAAGTATLDAFLARAANEFKIQNFFTFSRNRYYWSSHAPDTSGGQAYPSWKGLSLYNVNGTGSFLNVTVQSVPSGYLPGSKRRTAISGAPMVAVYATKNNNMVNVFVLSRKLDNYPFLSDDGYTPVTVHLPFALDPTNGKITRYCLTGPPRANNLDADNVILHVDDIPVNQFSSTFKLTTATGAGDRGLPPASIYMYKFEGVKPISK